MSILREVESNPHAKLLLYEPKREFFAWLSSLGLKSKISYFMPSDERSVALDFAEDYRDDKDADTLAYAFFPDQKNSSESSFWAESLRAIYASVYVAIKAKLGRADLRLVCLVLEDLGLTRKVLDFDPYLVQARKLTAKTGKSESETIENIQVNIHSRIRKMKTIATHLDCAARERPLFSLRKFIKEPQSGILVISKDEDYKHTQDPMNGVLFLRFTQLLAKEQEDPRRKVFVVIDEFPTLCGDDPCPGVKEMFYRLRSRGGLPLITDQGLGMLQPIYGDETKAILGQCSNMIFLQQPDTDSAEDAAKTLGVERGYEKKRNLGGGEGFSVSTSHHWFDRPIVDPSKLQNLFKASEKRGVEGWAKSSLFEEKKPWHFPIPPGDIDEIPKTRKDLFALYIERDSDSQRLRRLSDSELKELTREATLEGEAERWAKLLDG